MGFWIVDSFTGLWIPFPPIGILIQIIFTASFLISWIGDITASTNTKRKNSYLKIARQIGI